MTQIIVREISPLERTALERHFLKLDAEDRRLRFGISLSDAALRAYVARIDFEHDVVFGVVDDDLHLLGAAHLARGDGHAELGVSVLPGHRGRGIGSALLDRAHTRCRNWGMRALFMHCLTENGAMMHLARKQGMEIGSQAGETDAWLRLPAPDTSSHFGEMLAQRVALFDFALKTQLANTRRIVDALAPPAASSDVAE